MGGQRADGVQAEQPRAGVLLLVRREQSANVKAENDMDFLKTCKTTGKGSCDSKPKVQTLACCGYRNCSAHCKYDYSTDTECSYWQLDVGAGAATRANLAVTL